MSLPLEGVRVLDLSRLLPGGFCSLLLADFGADVIKVEDTGMGDYVRWAPPYYEGPHDSARSALFLPYANLGLIVVDEEHDQAYKQDEGAHYHARDMAVVRGHIAKIPVVLASATPSIESEVNARKGRYQRIVLPSRFGGQHMPQIEAIDLRRQPPPRGRFISPVLAEQVQLAIERREQALLFLNRRGYAPLTLCRKCGHRFGCTICDAWLVDHRFRQRLVCHHCGFSMPRPDICPHCASEQSLVAVGPGVERLQEEVAALFPQARTMVLSSDLITSIETMRSELNEIAQGRVDIIIGTQLVAKGHHFPRLNLVGVVDADLGLSNGDPRAAERTFQLLNQVIGRAGRDQGRGVGYLQTHQPEHPVMKALVACDREAFYASEIAARERTGYPPFGRLASLIISAGDRPTAEGFARRLAAIAPVDPRIQVLGPAEAPLAVIKGRYRFRLLVKSLRAVDLSHYLREWLAAAVTEEVADDLNAMRLRQESHLRRELARVDDYFANYQRELSERAGRSRNEGTKLKAGERLLADLGVFVVTQRVHERIADAGGLATVAGAALGRQQPHRVVPHPRRRGILTRQHQQLPDRRIVQRTLHPLRNHLVVAHFHHLAVRLPHNA